MSEKFKCSGLFYEVADFKLRKCLDIKRTNSLHTEPELMVIMMNPGSSCPVDGGDDDSQIKEASADNTLQKIIKLMKAVSINFTRILNLSDLRTPSSKTLYEFIASDEARLINHSIFNPARRSELDLLFNKKAPVIFAWGVNPALLPLAKQAVESLNIQSPLGRLKTNTEYAYYHPLPRSRQQQLEWIEEVASQLKVRQAARDKQKPH